MSADEYTASDIVYSRRLYLCGGNFPLPRIFQYYPYTELAVDFYYSIDAPDQLFDAMADESSEDFDKTAVIAGHEYNEMVSAAGFYC